MKVHELTHSFVFLSSVGFIRCRVSKSDLSITSIPAGHAFDRTRLSVVSLNNPLGGFWGFEKTFAYPNQPRHIIKEQLKPATFCLNLSPQAPIAHQLMCLANKCSRAPHCILHNAVDSPWLAERCADGGWQ